VAKKKDVQYYIAEVTNKHKDVGLLAVNVHFRTLPLIYITSNEMKKEFFAKEVQHLTREPAIKGMDNLGLFLQVGDEGLR
jgi:hypothetical protein